MSNVSILKDVKLAHLKNMLSKSTKLSGGVLNFEVSSDKIQSVASNIADNFFKKWEINTAEIAAESKISETIKISIYKGSEFVKDVLSYFGSSADMKFFHDNGETNKIEVSNADLQITLVTAPISLNYVEYEEESLQYIFGSEGEKTSFELSKEELARIISLSKLSTNPETQTEYVRFYTDGGMLKATDNAFDVALHSTDQEILTDIRLSKDSINLFCLEDQLMTAIKLESETILLASSKESSTVASVMLVEDLDASEDISDLSAEFNWGV